jgi:hypothetical protein
MLTIGDVYEVVIEQTYANQQILNVWHVRLLAVPAAPVTPKFATLAMDMVTVARARQNVNLSYLRWRASQVAGAGITYDATTGRPIGGDFYEDVFSGINGQQGAFGDLMPPHEAFLLDYTTGLRGRRHQGRKFFSGMTEGDQASGVIIAATLTALAATTTTFLTKYGSGGTDPTFRWGVFSPLTASGFKSEPFIDNGRVRHHMVRVADPDPANSCPGVTTAVWDNLVHTMHRRQIGVGS